MEELQRVTVHGGDSLLDGHGPGTSKEPPRPSLRQAPSAPGFEGVLDWDERALLAQCQKVLGELRELKQKGLWEDMVTLCHPLHEKYPALVDAGLVDEVRRELAFAMVRLNMHQEAMALIEQVMMEGDGHEDYLANYTYAYIAYDALYRHKNRESRLSQEEKARYVEKAHRYFRRCQELSPERVTPFYREAMLYKEIEAKTRKAIPIFERAIANWDAYSPEEQDERHYERPKFVRGLYHLASCYLKHERVEAALKALERLMAEDLNTSFVHEHFKHFAMAKVLYRLGRYGEALGHLEISGRERPDPSRPHAPDYVVELECACLLGLGDGEAALKCIRRIPDHARRPYVRWREADVLVALGHPHQALQCLERALERDSRSRHKTLVKMAKIHYSMGEYDAAISCSKKACAFFKKVYQNPLHEASYVEALCLYMKGEARHALELMAHIKKEGFRYPGFNKVYGMVKAEVEKEA